ncbi:quinone oxidoreductase family protein [Capillimicrobium parvum]|uniref:2-haloacrylate reductase n=1 Tax=Capillimicrobium parvum TaxID=2884022 RepID=A0A9E7C035_9ACTN|nr:zinc-binding dehydrogenase [Capillimicrobium parvum]UGS36015.1 2-haloacrylate reductase [Capillimicrobium parvum]
MHAAAFTEYGAPGVLRWQEVPDPPCGPDDVVVETVTCGLNHVDLDCRAGTAPWELALPHVLGAEFAGTIVEVGAAVRGWEIGRPVTAHQQFACGTCADCARWRPDLCPHLELVGYHRWGGYGAYVRVPAKALIALDSIDQADVAASAQCVLSVAWNMVTRLARVTAGETVLVPSASGGVAGALVQVAKLAGARVIATTSSAEKAPHIEALGADDVIVYGDTPVAEAVAELTGGAGADAVLDTVGGPMINDHLASLRPDGRLAICGAHAGETAAVDLLSVFVRGSRILGFRICTPDDERTALRLALTGQVTIPIAARFPIERAADAHAYLGERRHVGKVILEHPTRAPKT